MNSSDYFFLLFLGTITVTRVLLLSKVASPTLKGFRFRHYMYGIILMIFAFFMKNISLSAIGLGLFVDEAPIILVKGPGHRPTHWNGCEDYRSQWCVVGVLVVIFVVYIFREAMTALIA